MSIPQRLKQKQREQRGFWNNPKFKISFKVFLSLLSLYYLWHAVNQIDWSIWSGLSWQIVLGLGALVVINWSLESWKWKVALQNSHRISFAEAILQVCIGVAVGFFTPGRLGELAGRSALQKQNHGQAFGAAALSSLAQGGTTTLFGLFAVFYFGRAFVYGYLLVWGVLSISALLALIGVFFFLFRSFWLQQIRKLPLSKFYIILIISILRYLVFFAEFILLLQVVPYSVHLWPFLMAMGLYYFMGSFSPIFTFAEGGLKVFLATLSFPLINFPIALAVPLVLMVWIVNLMPPVLVGVGGIWLRKRR